MSFTLRVASLALVSLSILFASVVWPLNALLTCSSAQSVLPSLQYLLFSFAPVFPLFAAMFFLVSVGRSFLLSLIFLFNCLSL